MFPTVLPPLCGGLVLWWPVALGLALDVVVVGADQTVALDDVPTGHAPDPEGTVGPRRSPAAESEFDLDPAVGAPHDSISRSAVRSAARISARRRASSRSCSNSLIVSLSRSTTPARSAICPDRSVIDCCRLAY